MKIQYCPVCMNEMVDAGIMTFKCPYCKVGFHISVEYSTKDLQEATKDRDDS